MRSQGGARSRLGQVLIVIGVCSFGLAFLVGLVSFFVPSQPGMPLLEVLTVLVPGVVGILGFGCAVTGAVILISRR